MVPKRHHYVPRLLLQGFSPKPEAKNPPLWRLDKASGRLALSSVNNEAVISHYNRLETAMGVSPAAPEELLSVVEGHAAGSIVQLHQGHPLSREERANFALFLALQQQRTPQGRQQQVFIQELAAKLALLQGLHDDDFVREFWDKREEQTAPVEVEEWRRGMIKQVEDGSLVVRAPHDREVYGMFLAATLSIAPINKGMSWCGLRAPAGTQFIIADHPLAFYDPQAGPDDPVAWLSSPTVEVTIPLSSSLCLMLVPGQPAQSVAEVDADRVREINLRSYAAAHWAIFGPTEAAVRQVRRDAEQAPDRVAAFELSSVKGDRSPMAIRFAH